MPLTPHATAAISVASSACAFALALAPAYVPGVGWHVQASTLRTTVGLVLFSNGQTALAALQSGNRVAHAACAVLAVFLFARAISAQNGPLYLWACATALLHLGVATGGVAISVPGEEKAKTE